VRDDDTDHEDTGTVAAFVLLFLHGAKTNQIVDDMEPTSHSRTNAILIDYNSFLMNQGKTIEITQCRTA
jgi:hypothetical protein